jgi:general secretion pathway protein L
MPDLIIVLPAGSVTPETVYDFVLADGTDLLDHGQCTAREFPPTDLVKQTIALAPAQALSWHRVTLPDGVSPGSARMRAVLDGLLEDQLLDEPATLHFALPPTPVAGAAQWVAALNRRWLAIAVQTLEAEGRHVSRVVPEWGPPEGELRLHLTGSPEAPQLVVCGLGGVSVLPLDSGNADAASLGLPDDALTSSLRASAEPALQPQAEAWLQRPVQPITRHARWMAAARSRWDLANRLLMRRHVNRSGIEWLQAPRWRAARWGAILLLLVNLVGLNALAWSERSQLASKRAEVNAWLTRTFPNVRVVVDAPVQMQRELRLLEQASGVPAPGDLDAMLSALTAALPQGATLKAIDYADSQLRLKQLGLDADASAALRTRLEQARYSLSAEGAELLVRPMPATTPTPSGQTGAVK